MEPRKSGKMPTLSNYPVCGVCWFEALAFCNWLSIRLGMCIVLPTYAEWEKAARSTDGRRRPWGEEITPDHANYFETGLHTTTPVGIFPKGRSHCGALDLIGNVWEWTSYLSRRGYSISEYYDRVSYGNVKLRGCGYYNRESGVSCAVNGGSTAIDDRDDGIGFRPVLLPDRISTTDAENADSVAIPNLP